MNEEELLKKLYYDLDHPNVYVGKSKLLEEAGNHRRLTKEELLKKIYYDLKNPAAYAGKSKLFQEAKKHDWNISIENVEEWLKSKFVYTSTDTSQLKMRPVVVRQIDEQWQIDLMDMSKLSSHHNVSKFIMVIIDILSNYAWVELLKSKHGIAIKIALEQIFS